MKEYKTATNGVYAVMRHAIITGLLEPGSAIREDMVAKDLGVSRTPVREAVRKLESEGLVNMHPAKGLTVTTFTRQQLIDIYYIREALEGMAARLAAQNASAIDLSILRQVVHDMEQANEGAELEQLQELTSRFHLHFCEMARNDRLFVMIKDLQDQIRRFTPSTLQHPGRREEAMTEHLALLKAVEERDADNAEKIMRQHRRRTLEVRLAMRAWPESNGEA